MLEQAGVRSAAIATLVLLVGGRRLGRFADVDDYNRPPDDELRIDVVYATPDYFETLGIPLLAGRDFSDQDGEDAADVAMVSLGAGRGQVVRMVLRGMASPLVLGLLGGDAAAVLLDGALERFLYGVAPGDATTYPSISLGLAVVALAATLLPARAAARIDPVEVLNAG